MKELRYILIIEWIIVILSIVANIIFFYYFGDISWYIIVFLASSLYWAMTNTRDYNDMKREDMDK
jgi:hypothetical protein